MERSVAIGRKRLAQLLVSCLACVAGVMLCSAPAGALPPGWGYELISPADPLGADIDFGAGSADGNHAWVASTIPVTDDGHTGNLSSLAAVRTTGGWQLSDLADASVPTNDSAQLLARSADGSRSVVQRCPAVLIACDQYVRFERVESDGSRSLVLDVTPFVLGQGPPVLTAASDDLSALFVQTFPGLPPLLAEDTHTQGQGLYVSLDGDLEFIGYDEDDNVLDCGAVLANGRSGAGFEQSGISADGATAFYEGPDPDASCADPVDVYVRRDGHSVNASAPRNGNPNDGATYLGNSRDGNTVYFLTTSQLVIADTDAFADIYAYDVPSDTLTRITPGSDVRQAVVSPEGDYVYFKAFNSIGGQGTDGERNFYVHHAGTTQFIATAPNGGNFTLGGAMNSAAASPLSPDGKHLLFRANAEFAGASLGGTTQFFRYDLPSNTFACVSCPVDGSPPSTDVEFPTANPTGNADQRLQSDDGRTVVFHSFNRLVPQDVNDSLDVYMWHDGVTSLISSGRGQRDSQIVSTDAAGHNVFFTTSDRLTPDVDQDNTKLYVARLGGGFPFNPPSPSCGDDSCQPPLTDNPSYAPGGSETFVGSGNQGGRAGRPARLGITRLTAGARRQLLQHGRVTLKVRVGKKGKLHVRATTTAHGRRITLAHVTRTAHRAGTVQVRIRLSRRARATLHGGAVVRFAVTLAGRTVTRPATLPRPL